eukprot:c27239_g1_i1.p1 GENE.c27239_g1_i1~~c27239_g1_i1.p1  ORF type:complete len:239 (+),score=45.55 c27239_g1_i1:26-742(+)
MLDGLLAASLNAVTSLCLLSTCLSTRNTNIKHRSNQLVVTTLICRTLQYVFMFLRDARINVVTCLASDDDPTRGMILSVQILESLEGSFWLLTTLGQLLMVSISTSSPHLTHIFLTLVQPNTSLLQRIVLGAFFAFFISCVLRLFLSNAAVFQFAEITHVLSCLSILVCSCLPSQLYVSAALGVLAVCVLEIGSPFDYRAERHFGASAFAHLMLLVQLLLGATWIWKSNFFRLCVKDQ